MGDSDGMVAFTNLPDAVGPYRISQGRPVVVALFELPLAVLRVLGPGAQPEKLKSGAALMITPSLRSGLQGSAAMRSNSSRRSRSSPRKVRGSFSRSGKRVASRPKAAFRSFSIWAILRSASDILGSTEGEAAHDGVDGAHIAEELLESHTFDVTFYDLNRLEDILNMVNSGGFCISVSIVICGRPP